MTGYCHNLINNNMNFAQFVWECSRAFGALIMMRDEPGDAPIDFDKACGNTDYEVKSLAEAEAKIAQLNAMTDEEAIEAWADAIRTKAILDESEYLAKQERNVAKLCDMRDAVRRWQPPTVDHKELKSFMLEQLETSIKSEGGDYYQTSIAKWKARTAQDILTMQRDSAERSLNYAKDNLAKAQKRIAGRRKWLEALNESVPYKQETE